MKIDVLSQTFCVRLILSLKELTRLPMTGSEATAGHATD